MLNHGKKIKLNNTENEVKIVLDNFAIIKQTQRERKRTRESEREFEWKRKMNKKHPVYGNKNTLNEIYPAVL